MKKPLKQKITDYINSLSEELRSSIEYKKKKPNTPKLRKVASLLLVFSLVIYLLIGCFGSIKSSAASVPTDLTGYTVNVPAGWTASAGYGIYSAQGTLNGTSFNTGIRIGYSEGSPWNNFVEGLYNNRPFEKPNSEALVFTFISGADLTESSLIQWFVDNNATFVDPNAPSTFTVSPGLYFLRYPLSTLRGTISFSTPFVSHSSFYTSIEFVGIESNEQLSINYVDSEDNITNVYYGDTGWRDDEYSVILVQQDVIFTQEEYDLFNGAFVSLAENDTLNTLYNAGLENGQAFGFSQGYDSGYAVGYTDGFTSGAADGMADGFMGNFFGGIVEALDALKLFGELSVLNIIEAVLGLMLVVWILKLIAGG